MNWPKFLENPRSRKVIFASLASVAAAGVGTYLYASLIEARRYRLDSVKVNTGTGDDGPFGYGDEPLRLRVLHLSDLHLSKPESHKLEFLRRATEEQYDLIVITGDIFENYSGLEYANKIVSRPPRIGTYAVLGNHDYYDYNMLHRTVGRVWRRFRAPKEMRNVEPMVQALEAAGIQVLRNSSVTHQKDKLHIVGIDYPGIAEQQLKQLVDKAPADHLILTLIHVPNRLERLQDAGVHLAFGGHTHGGQVRLPIYGPIITNSDLPRREASGLIWRGATAIHVSRGVGADPRSNFRLFCPPHGSIIEVCHRA